ncbi:hypothetical protein [Ensifer sp. 1H6]|uniref:hypothetical protein n=1 Tax=Ensifer sp. 1H6 TaxID=1911585 RepID=UPI0009D13CAE|nr:hypothetical protein [Ensifer sp. 1H6]OMQ42747.1 hypothetical protein BKP54_22140 [Ensifer sp. 1H6]
MSIHDFPDAGGEPGDTSGLSRFAAAIGSRLVGPGGYYNLGNGLGLVTGVTIQIVAVPPSSALSGHAALLDYFVGSIAALSLTMATLVFFWSGEIYCRAWARKPPPDASLNRLGDMLSGIGAIGLGIALFLFGEPVLAATSGLLHALGKFGSAFEDGRPLPGWPANWLNPFRSAVLASRLPALVSAAVGSGIALQQAWSGASWVLVAAPLTLLVCYLLWAKAALLLLLQEVRAGSALASSSGNRRDGA